jgi:hypothetical protein
MTTVAVGLAALLAVVCVVAVALPFLREPEALDDRLDAPDELERRRLELAEERDRVLADLKELEFDHRTGKVSDDDYRALVGPLRSRAASALRALEPRAEAGNLPRSAAMSEPFPAPSPEPSPSPDVPQPPTLPDPVPPPEPFPSPDEGEPPPQPSIPGPGSSG